MNNYDLSVLIPARNEMFLSKTVESILSNKRGKTEVIVGLDGEWANPPLTDHPDLTVVYSPTSLGQRGMTNQLARLSKAKYVMKIDAHCIVDEGFDVKMMEEMQDDYTMIPTMYNLHAFDWVCIGKDPKPLGLYVEVIDVGNGCGHKIYQGPTPDNCPNCGGNMVRFLVWQPRWNRKSNYYRFDKTLHFQYWGDYGNRPEAQKEVCEIFSAQGSCFMLTRAKYWELNICDENHGSWGQQGTEIACATWLSGGKLVVNKKTWYSHMFRTQGGDFSFPYPLSGKEVEKARQYSRDLWLNNKHPKQIHDFNWLIEKFKPIPDWHEPTEVPAFTSVGSYQSGSKGIVFYTDNRLNLKIAHKVQKQLQRIGLPIVSTSLKPMPHFGKNIHITLERGVEAYFKQIITALENLDAEIVYFCEHDVLYHPSHFDFTPPRKDMFYYNVNFWRIRSDGFAVHWDANQVSGLVCNREFVLDWYKKRYEEVKQHGFDRSYEPGGRDPKQYEQFRSTYPNIDIRHEGNLTRSKWSPNDFRDKSTCVNWKESDINDIPGWNATDLAFK